MATLEDGGSSMFLHLLAKPGFKKIYVLNGHTGALPHLWEYFKITNDAIAKNLFEKGTGYLKNHLPEFDCGDWSYYDRTGTVAMESYHKGQIRQLDRRYRITREPVVERYGHTFLVYYQQKHASAGKQVGGIRKELSGQQV